MSSPSDAIADGSPRIFWERDGSSHGEKVVFIHALGCNLDLWDAIVPLIPADFQSIRYDLSGHGRSAAGPDELSIEDHAQDLIHVLDECGAEDANLVGVSVGGMIALAAALMEPSRIRRLVLCATAGRIGSVERWSERIAMVRGQGLNALADGILMRWFAPGFAEREPGVLRQARAWLVNMPANGYVASCAALRDTDLRPLLSGIRCPALVLCGEDDVATPPQWGRELAAALPDARFELIAGAGHLPPLEQPLAFARALERFLNEPP